MKIVAIIQARMGSTRLPGKTMMKILGKPIIQHVIDRVKKSRLINKVWLITTVNKEDDALVKWAENNYVKYYRGGVEDVLDSYYQTALLAGADAVVRITGDCPLIDSKIIDKVVVEYLKGNADYVCNRRPPTFPDGLDTEIFSLAALKKDWTEARLKSDREHVTTYVWRHPNLFKLKSITHSPDLSKHRWTLDTKKDFSFIKKIICECAKRNLEGNTEDILNIIKDHPEWLKINKGQLRNEGYLKSLKQDGKPLDRSSKKLIHKFLGNE